MNPRKLFVASCVSLVTTSMVFSIRGDIVDALSADFHINNKQMGEILSPAFWGFTLAIIFGGSLVDFLGMRNLLTLSSLGYIASIILILLSPRPSGPVESIFSETGTIVLYAAMLIMGLSQGLVEAVINPLIATIFSENKTHKLNALHAWWPGGLIIGGLIAFGITKMMGLDSAGVSPATATRGWQVKLSVIIVPAIVFLVMIVREKFPATERVAAGVSTGDMFKELGKPLFLLLFACMWMTAATELGPDQWVSSLISNLTKMNGVLILVYTAGLMFVMRHFAGPLAHRLSPFGLLMMSSILSAVGLLALSNVSSIAMAFAAATVFGIGKAYFWPTMLGVTSERFPRGGPLLLAIMGGAGMLSTAFILPIMGGWYDTRGAAAAFRYVAVLPVILTVIFGALFFYFRAAGGYKAVKLSAEA
ncbi:MAG TPA: MFS transporter [Blastocatellia bacterium]|nr:MFS transporter [Blastocatellia bacterium]